MASLGHNELKRALQDKTEHDMEAPSKIVLLALYEGIILPAWLFSLLLT